MSFLDKIADIASTPFGFVAVTSVYPSAGLLAFGETGKQAFIVSQAAGASLGVGAYAAVGLGYSAAAAGMAGSIAGLGVMVIGARLGYEAPRFPQESSSRLLDVREPAAPWRWIYGQVRVGGVYTYLEVDGPNRRVHGILTIAAHECEELGEIWLDDEAATLDADGFVQTPAKYLNLIRIKKSTGNEAEGVQPFADLQTESDGLWTSAHRQTGHAKLYVRFEMSGALADGMPRISCVLKGRKVFDPRSAASPAERAYSTNAALCAADYLACAIGLAADFSTEIGQARLSDAADTCDEQVALAGASPTEYESRYTANGMIGADKAPRQAIAELNTAMAGYARFVGGEWLLYPGAFPTPEATALTDDDLRGAIRIVSRVPKRDLCNAVRGLYVSADNDWQATDFPPVTNATYLSEDQDERLWRSLNLPFTTSSAAAQRIGKIELERTRQQITLEWAGKLTCYRLQPGDVVPVTLDKFGWSAKEFEVMSQRLSAEDDGAGGVVLGCDLVLRETASGVFDWNSGEETVVDPAPDSNLPDHLGPSNVTGAIVRQNGALVIFECDRVEDSDLESIEIRKAPLGATDWDMAVPITRILRGNTGTSAAVEPGEFTFFFKAQDYSGNYSTDAATYDLEITGAGYSAIEDIEAAPAWVPGEEAEVTTTRAGATATRVNASGLIETVAADTPRFDYDPVTLECKGLLIEGARTNLCLQSEDISTTWTNVRTSETVNAITSPGGAANADKIVEDSTAGDTHYIQQTITFAGATAYASSVYLKAAERSWAMVNVFDGVESHNSYFNLATGVVGTATGATGTIEDAGGGWYRCTVLATTHAGAGAGNLAVFTATADFGIVHDGDGSSGIYIWGSQVEAGANPSSYIPTTSAAVTRNADVAVVSDISGFFNADEGTMVTTAMAKAVRSDDHDMHATFTNAAGDHYIRTEFVAVSGNMFDEIYDGTSQQASMDAGAYTFGEFATIALAFKANDFAISGNGNAVVTDSSGVVPSVDRLHLGCGQFASNGFLNGHLRRFAYYRKRLSDADLVLLSAGEEVADSAEVEFNFLDGSMEKALDGTNMLKHYTGVLVVDSSKAASEHTIAELFEQFVPYPVGHAVWTAPEIDKGIDADARIRVAITTRAGRDRTDGDVKPDFEVDYKTSTGSYDGYEAWTVGTARFRTMKGRIYLDTSLGRPVVEGLEIIIDAPTRAENFPEMAVASGGTAFAFETPFHSTPSITITPIGTTALRTSVESPSGTGGIAHLFNTSDAGVAGTVNVSAQGA